MLSRTAHVMYLAAIVCLAAAVLAPSLRQRSNSNQGSTGASPRQQNEFGQFALALEAGAAPPTVRLPERGRRISEGASNASTPQQPSQPHQPRSGSELVQRWLEVAADIDPDLGKRLRDLYEKNPAEFDTAMRHGNVGRNLNSMAILKHRDPELYQTKVTQMMQTVVVNRIATQLRDAIRSNSAAQIESLKAELKTALEHQLAHELKAKGDYICKIEEQLEQARQELIEAAVSFPHTIEARMDAHMKPRTGGESQPLELGDEAASLVDDQSDAGSTPKSN